MINLKTDISTLVNDLSIIADNLEIIGVSETGPHQLFTFVTKLKTTNMIIKCFWTPKSIRARIKKLKTAAIVITRTNIPSLKRPRYSKKIAQQFIKDGELDNYKAYRALYDLRS